MLHRHGGHGEAVTRISWCIDQHALGVITGEVGAGKTVAVRAATAGLDTSRHPPAPAEARCPRRPRSADLRPLRTGRNETRRHRRLHHPPPQDRRPLRHPLSADAVTLIHNAARGYPRAVNNLAINALTAAFARNQAIVDAKAAGTAATEPTATNQSNRRPDGLASLSQ
jgi:hypothetical protein